MDWTFENDMVDGLFFCATLTGRIRCHISYVQAGAGSPERQLRKASHCGSKQQ